MGEDIVVINLDEALRNGDRFVKLSVIVQGHSQPVQDVLIIRVDLQRLAIQSDGVVELVVSEGFNSLLENLFLCHGESIAIESGATMENITTSNVKFPYGAAQGSGFLATPANGGPRPGLLVIQEWWGMNDHIKDITTRLANEGFAALAVDMYDGKVTKDPKEAQGIMMAMDKTAAMDKLNGAVAFLKGTPQVGNVGVIGFCMGGFFSLSLACNNKEIRAAAPFYGSVPPNELLSKLNAPVIYFYGEKDQHITSADIDRLEQLMKSAGNAGGVVRYPESDHAFFNDTRKEVYNPRDAKDAWTRALTFLRKNLG